MLLRVDASSVEDRLKSTDTYTYILIYLYTHSHISFTENR